jgi:hypothetical protein
MEPLGLGSTTTTDCLVRAQVRSNALSSGASLGLDNLLYAVFVTGGTLWHPAARYASVLITGASLFLGERRKRL